MLDSGFTFHLQIIGGILALSFLGKQRIDVSTVVGLKLVGRAEASWPIF